MTFQAFDSQDERYMKSAIEEGEKARLISPPNPWVGCVLMKDGKIVGKGHTQAPGGHHAEVMALLDSREKAEGSTAYVTLEPCAHFGRTPPCSRALIQAKVKRVVIVQEDPDLQVKGKGIKELIAAGISVSVGTCAQEAAYQLRAYLHHRRTGRPYVIIKTAISIDGRTAAQDGTSQWITSDEARRDAHSLRASSQAIMIGSGTALADNPSLTVRDVPLPLNPPLRILYDRRGRVPPKGPLFDPVLAPTLVLTTDQSSIEQRDAWIQAGATVEILSAEFSIENVLTNLGSKGIIQLMIEGGPTFHGSILQKKASQEMVVYMGNTILGEQGLPAFVGLKIPTIKEAPRAILTNSIMLGSTIKNVYSLMEGDA